MSICKIKLAELSSALRFDRFSPYNANPIK
jgi:hypothetical protein